eukprot:scaffold1052_cov339-Pavlova_lutheri.AAC.51
MFTLSSESLRPPLPEGDPLRFSFQTLRPSDLAIDHVRRRDPRPVEATHPLAAGLSPFRRERPSNRSCFERGILRVRNGWDLLDPWPGNQLEHATPSGIAHLQTTPFEDESARFGAGERTLAWLEDPKEGAEASEAAKRRPKGSGTRGKNHVVVGVETNQLGSGSEHPSARKLLLLFGCEDQGRAGARTIGGAVGCLGESRTWKTCCLEQHHLLKIHGD